MRTRWGQPQVVIFLLTIFPLWFYMFGIDFWTLFLLFPSMHSGSKELICIMYFQPLDKSEFSIIWSHNGAPTAGPHMIHPVTSSLSHEQTSLCFWCLTYVWIWNGSGNKSLHTPTCIRKTKQTKKNVLFASVFRKNNPVEGFCFGT